MNTCPGCGKISPRHMRQCPLHNMNPVCTDCCSCCEHYDLYGMPACRYIILHPRIDFDGEIKRLRRRADVKLKEAKELYERSRPKEAEIAERTALNILGERKRLEEMQEEEERTGVICRL